MSVQAVPDFGFGLGADDQIVAGGGVICTTDADGNVTCSSAPSRQPPATIVSMKTTGEMFQEWFQQNAWTIGAVLIGLVVVPPLLRGGRR